MKFWSLDAHIDGRGNPIFDLVLEECPLHIKLASGFVTKLSWKIPQWKIPGSKIGYTIEDAFQDYIVAPIVIKHWNAANFFEIRLTRYELEGMLCYFPAIAKPYKELVKNFLKPSPERTININAL